MLSIDDINFLEKDYPQLRVQRNRLLNLNRELYQQVYLQALIIKQMALDFREKFASDFDVNKIIKYYSKIAENEMLRDKKAVENGNRQND